MKKIISMIVGCFIVCSCGWQNIKEVKQNAKQTWEQNGYEIVGYQGYEIGPWLAPTYGGAYVWYSIKKIPDNGIIYNGAIQRWGNEYHIYNLQAIDAIKPKN